MSKAKAKTINELSVEDRAALFQKAVKEASERYGIGLDTRPTIVTVDLLQQVDTIQEPVVEETEEDDPTATKNDESVKVVEDNEETGEKSK